MPGLPSRAAAVRLRLSHGFREGWTQRRDVHGFTASTSNPRFAGEASDGGLPRPWSHGVANRVPMDLFARQRTRSAVVRIARFRAVQRNETETVMSKNA